MILEIGGLLVGLLLFMYLLSGSYYGLVTGYLIVMEFVNFPYHYFNPPISPFRKGGIERGFYVSFNSGFLMTNNYFKRCRRRDKIKFVIKEIAINNKVIKEKITKV